MSDPHDVDDHIDPLSAWIRSHPEAWGDAVTPLDTRQLHALVDRALDRAHESEIRIRRRRHRRMMTSCIVGAAVVAGGAAGVAAILRGQPSQPAAGVACMDAVGDDAVVVAISPTDDPIAGCEAAWRAGRFNEDREHPSQPPPFVACISPGGAVQVHPIEFGTCEALGLAVADPTLDDASLAVVSLNERIIALVNSASPCLSAADASATAQRIIDDALLTDWRIEIRADSVDASCAKAAVDAQGKVVTLVKFP